MTTTSLNIFDETVQKSEQWVKELEKYMQTEDNHHAYSALRCVLHALRDRLTVNEAVDLSAQLPLLIKGVYFEGWKPSKQPVKLDTRDEFVAYVNRALNTAVDPLISVKAVFYLLDRHITGGEIKHVKSNLPAELKALWPQ